MQTKKLTNLAFYPVAHHGTSDLSAYGYAKSRKTILINLPDNQEGRTGKTGPASRESYKIRPLQETSSFCVK